MILRQVAFLEAISFLVLLGVAMPLKHFAGEPGAVRVVGWIHGALFILFVVTLLRAMVAARWSMGRAALVFVSALLPFGPFVIHRRLDAYEAQFRQSHAQP